VIPSNLTHFVQDLAGNQLADFLPPSLAERRLLLELPCVKHMPRHDFLEFALHVLDELSAWCVPLFLTKNIHPDFRSMLSEISRITGVPARSISAERSKVRAPSF